MGGKTPETFTDDLDAGLAWRRVEIQALRSEVNRVISSAPHPPRDRMVLRAAVAFLYAHWEGYSKQALQGYLDYVSRLRLKVAELNPGLRATSLRHQLEEAMRDPEALIRLVSGLDDLASSRARVPRRGVVDTGSNLRYDKFASILLSLGVDGAEFETRRTLIDVRLCDARNSIAHGGADVPDRDSVLELLDLVLELMEGVRTALMNAVAQKSYRYSPVAGASDLPL